MTICTLKLKSIFTKGLRMKVSYKINILFFLVASLLGSNPSFADANVLIQQQHLQYKGAFRVPRGYLGGDSKIWSMGRGGVGITYNSANNSLILLGSSKENLAIEISIPSPIISNNIADLNTSTTVQVPGNIANSQWSNLNLDGSEVTNGGSPGSLLVYNGKLIGNAFAYYPGSATVAHLSHFTASLNWASTGSQFSGFKRVGVNPTISANSNGGWVGGYMCHVPTDWQERLGAPVLTGNGAIPIISRSSYGPSIWGFNPDDIGVETITPAELFVGYPDSHQTLGTYSGGTLYYNMVTSLAGAVFPSGSDSILIFGSHGLGEDGKGMGCYGTGTSDQSLHRTPVGDGSIYCYDPIDSAKGGHAYPYVAQIWAYNANDILDVKSGAKQYWQIIPYARWNFSLPFVVENSPRTDKKKLGGVAYDPTTQQVFISQITADSLADQFEPNPIIHVYGLDLAAPQPAPTPIIMNIK